MTTSIGIDIGGTKVSGGVLDADGRILVRTRRDTPDRSSRICTRAVSADCPAGRSPPVYSAISISCEVIATRAVCAAAGSAVVSSRQAAREDRRMVGRGRGM